MPDITSTDDEADLLAAELVLGVLDDSERLTLRARSDYDSNFAGRVDRWEARLVPLLKEIAPVTPPRSVWHALSVRLPERPERLRKQLWRWQAGAGAMAAVAATLAVLLFLPTRPATVPSDVQTRPVSNVIEAELAVAQLSNDAGTPLLAVGFERRTGQVRVRLQDLPREARVPELWIIPKGGVPRSLGLIRADGTVDRPLDDQARRALGVEVTVAVSLESPEGAPHAAPSGPIVATGPLVTL